MDTCCGMRLDLVDVLKKDQKSFGLEGRLLLREAKKFSRLSLISLLRCGGGSCISLTGQRNSCDGPFAVSFLSF